MSRTIYILGAGFSASCGIATDISMLEALNPLLDNKAPDKSPNTPGTVIDYLRDQLFFNQNEIGFETFMSALNGQSFLARCIDSQNDIFEREEEEIVGALKRYLVNKVDTAVANGMNNPVCQFIDHVNWGNDIVITFNYDLLLEKFLELKQIRPKNEILHLHGSVEELIVYPNYRKFTDFKQQTHFAERWRDAYNFLREKWTGNFIPVSEWVFIGYSMPATDAEAKGLFAYADYDNQGYGDKYKITVVNPDPNVAKNYASFRKKVVHHPLTMEQYLSDYSKLAK